MVARPKTTSTISTKSVYFIGLLLFSLAWVEKIKWGLFVSEDIAKDNADSYSSQNGDARSKQGEYQDPNRRVRNFTCSEKDREIIQYQLPPHECRSKKGPWMKGGYCSFSYASRCPESIWLEDYYNREAMSNHADSHQEQEQRKAIYVGCNKGMDAVNTLRMLSMNPNVDKQKWKDAFSKAARQKIIKGVCGQEHAEQFRITTNQTLLSSSSPTLMATKKKATVYCIEAMPLTARALKEASDSLDMSNHFHVFNVAVARNDGTVAFPMVTVGTENKGLDFATSCKAKPQQCKNVSVYKLDSFIPKFVNDNEGDSVMVDFLSIDIEGYDADALLGASETLTSGRIRYLEFEYNWKGQWTRHKLSTIVQMLQSHAYVCYWPGTGGNIWRISSSCWMDYYDRKYWSNVACVHESHTKLLDIMEDYFQKTLQAGNAIRYDSVQDMYTHGRKANTTTTS